MALAQQFQLPPPQVSILPPADLDLVANRLSEDAQGQIWLATDGGLGYFDGRQLSGFHDPHVPEGDDYSTATPTSDGRVWLLTGTGELVCFNPLRRRIEHLSDTTRLMREFIKPKGLRALFVDKHGQLWLGLRERGVLRVDPRTLAVAHVFPKARTVRHITEAPDGQVWFTSDSGVYVLDRRTSQTKGFFHDPHNPNSIGRNATMGICVRSANSVLVSMDEEVDVLNPQTGRVQRIRLLRSSPLEIPWTHDFLPDSQGNVYFSVGRAVYRLPPSGPLQRIEFPQPTEKIISILVSRTGHLWVNAGRRLDKYDLRSLRPVAPLNVLDITVNGTRLVENQPPGDDRFRRDSTGLPILNVREQDFVHMRFSPTVEERMNEFRVQLAGHDPQWMSFRDTIGQVTYQLAAGTYTFWLNLARPDGTWENDSTPMRVVVMPPFYKTTPFLVVAIFVIGTGLSLLYRTVRRRQKLRRELAKREEEAANLRQLDRLRSQFFANITHEFRTPLTLILAQSEQLGKQSLTANSQARVASVERNARQLLRLITQLLDTAKLDAGALEVKRVIGNPDLVLENLVQSFMAIAEKKGVTLIFEPGVSTCTGSFDAEKLEMIGYNLLSNALKFTVTGTVKVRTQREGEEQLLLVVQDTGSGIPPEHLPRIFERFYQVDASSTRAFEGTGIGLAFVRELTELLGGTVGVESTVGEGSTFTVRLPVAWVESVEATNKLTTATAAMPMLQQRVPNPAKGQSEVQPYDESKPLVLVVEDNDELRAFLLEQLRPSYRLLEASDGQEGLNIALSKIPDLIVSDVMMPHIDGYSLVSTLKADLRTSHVPVVLLTAKSSYDSKVRGLSAGGDAYLTKPFGLDELRLTLHNMLQTRQAWQAVLTAPLGSHTATDLVPEGEKRFLEFLRDLVRAHLQNETLDVKWVAEQAHLSRTHLHRKLTALTGHGTTWFINQIRLERAKELLESGKLNVSEVAYEVGYSSPSYFARVFQEHFGRSPVQVKE
jgi:signal transduction histidine kinase/DNA-binding response OmpR family regulator/streptogramin lyase